MAADRIPVANPRAAYLAHKDEIDGAIAAVLDRGRYILGEEVARFEEDFAAYLGTQFAIGVASGTDAVEIALRACGIGAGDAVLTVSNTAVATVAAIEHTGAEVVFADVDAASYTIDPESIEKTIASHRGTPVRAIVAVHLYGHPAPMGRIAEIAAAHGLRIVEDCAQAHGASIGAQRTGTFGDAAAFSFYPTKNLGSLGDGGAVVTHDPAIAERVRAYRQYGWRERYVSESRGWNSRLDELQAAVLRMKLRYLESENDRRRTIAAAFDGALSSSLSAPRVAPACRHVYHQYVLRTDRREAFRRFMDDRGIDTAILYPVPVHRQPAYLSRVSLPLTESLAGEIVSVPVFPELTDPEVARICDALRKVQ
ncbi:MAG TPA: DegT/DnrJ/EryC1/StrS family aminotransferase [Thermoanaerobaculia bacterium]|jgi:dTDP-4-amino-4,6-dideoxygalactose transaminase